MTGALLVEFAAGYTLGFETGKEVGYRLGVTDEGAAWSSVLTGCTSTWRSPRRDEVERVRIPDWRPCSMKCRRCSRCIASIAYWSRGGRPFLGIEGERELAQRGAVAS